MITALSVALVLSLSTTAARPCDGVVDRTRECSPPKDGGAPVLAGEKAPPATDAYDISGLPAQLGFASFALAFGGGGALVLGLVPTPSNEGERAAQEVAVYSGAGLLVWSGLVASGAAALWAFDASTGTMRIPIDTRSE